MIQTNFIQQFRFHEKYLAIDWDALKWAFIISIPDGIANVFFQPTDTSKYEHGMWFAFLPEDITRISYQKERDQKMGEISILIKDKRISLGMTMEDDTAKKWTTTANEVIIKAKQAS